MVNLDLLKSRLRGEEGWNPRVYDDDNAKLIRPGTLVVGHPTVGYGFALDVDDMPKEVAELWLDIKAKRVHADLVRLIPFWSNLSDIRQLALCEMAYQMGVHGVMLFKNALRAMAVQDWEATERHLLDSKWARDQSPSRAVRVAKMFLTGELQK